MYKIIGHRGDKEHFPENTLASFESALSGTECAGIELDIDVSSDQKFVVSHDRYFIDKNNKKCYMHDYTYDQIRQKAIEKFHGKNHKEIPLPLLEDLLTLYKKIDKNKIILIEIKILPSSPNMPLSFGNLIKKLHRLLNTYDLEEQCYIISFDYRVIQESKKQNPAIKTGLILEKNLLPVESLYKDLSFDILVMAHYWIIKEQIAFLKKHNVHVMAWTVNTDKESIRLSNLGVRYMISDRPLTLKKQIG